MRLELPCDLLDSCHLVKVTGLGQHACLLQQITAPLQLTLKHKKKVTKLIKIMKTLSEEKLALDILERMQIDLEVIWKKVTNVIKA